MLLPDVPRDSNDTYINARFARSLKPTTVDNMYSRWTTMIKDTLGTNKLPRIRGKVNVAVVDIRDDDIGLNHYAVAAIYQALGLKTVDNITNIRDFSITYCTFEQCERPPHEPLLLVMVSPDLNLDLREKAKDPDIIRYCLRSMWRNWEQ